MVNDVRTSTPETQEGLVPGEYASFDTEISPTPNDELWKMIWGIGGGTVEDFPIVRLSNKLLDTPIGSKPSSTDFTIGGVYLHEYLYHLHPIGGNEKNSGNPQEMRKHYNIATNNHCYSKGHGEGRRLNKMTSGN